MAEQIPILGNFYNFRSKNKAKNSYGYRNML